MVLLVTGCRSGFGLGIAVEAARRGHTVYAGLRDLETRDGLVAAAGGLDVRPVQLDVTDPDQRGAVVDRILEAHGRIDGLVNNAGVALGGFLEQIDEDELRKVFDVNVFGAWALTRRVLPAMRARGAGRIIMMSSVSGIMALPGLGAYVGSKFALEGLTEAWRHELGLMGIDIYLVEPGAYRTDIWGRNRAVSRHAHDPDSPWAAYAEVLDRRFAAVVHRSLREPDEVIERTLFLLEGPRRPLRHPLGPGTRIRRLFKLLPWTLLERRVRRTLFGDLPDGVSTPPRRGPE